MFITEQKQMLVSKLKDQFDRSNVNQKQKQN